MARWQGLDRLFEAFRIVEVNGEPLVTELDDQRVPGARRRGDVADRVDDRPFALYDFEIEEIVLEGIRANPPIAPVRRNTEGDAGGLVDLACDRIKADAEPEIACRRRLFSNREWEEGKRLHA